MSFNVNVSFEANDFKSDEYFQKNRAKPSKRVFPVILDKN